MSKEAMKLDKDDIETAKSVALTMQKCHTPELVVVGNLLAQLLAEREATLAREWVGLTDEEQESIANTTIRIHGQDWAYATAIEDKLKEKNT